MAVREHRGRRRQLLPWAAVLYMLLSTAWITMSLLHGHISGCAVAIESELPVAPVLALPQVGCEGEIKPEVAMMLMVTGHVNATWEVQYWMTLANRRAYALQHGYPLYIIRHSLGSGHDGAWEKLIGLRTVLKHSCAQWVWMSDVDAYIMQIDNPLTNITQNPRAYAHPHRGCNGDADIITAGACMTPINTGSVLWRNNDWTQQFVQDAWHSKWAAVRWRDQAVVLHLYNQTGYKDHFCIVTQHTMNVFPSGRCHDGQGTFRHGDFFVHFPGAMKDQIKPLNSGWLKLVPLAVQQHHHLSAQQLIFTIQRFDTATVKPGGQRVDITMESKMNEGKSRMPKHFSLYVEPQGEQLDNWGWPLPATQPVRDYLLSRSLPLPTATTSSSL